MKQNKGKILAQWYHADVFHKHVFVEDHAVLRKGFVS